jgi:hypothetical protein
MPRSCAARWTAGHRSPARRRPDRGCHRRRHGHGRRHRRYRGRAPRERLALALALAIGDLAGALPLARVVGELSTFADRALDAAIAAAIRRRAPDAEPRGFPRSRWASTARANSTIRPTSIPSCSTIRSPCPDAIATSRAKPRSAWRARSSNSPP